MNKKIKSIFITVCVAVTVLIGIVLNSTISEIASYERIEVQGNMIEYDYNQLKKESDIVALIECEDTIDRKNSILYKDKNYITGFSAKRNVQVIKTYKGKNHTTLNILEPAAVTDENKLLCIEDYEVMKKGDKYIVFLSNDTLSGDYSIISGNNGKISLDKINENEYFEIAFKGLIDLETDLSKNEKKKILNSNIKLDENVQKNKNITINENDILDFSLDYKEKNGTLYVDVD